MEDGNYYFIQNQWGDKVCLDTGYVEIGCGYDDSPRGGEETYFDTLEEAQNIKTRIEAGESYFHDYAIHTEPRRVL